MTNEAVAEIAGLLHDRLGLCPEVMGSQVVAGAMARCMEEESIVDATELCARLRESPAVFQKLVNIVTVPETWFMRDGHPFTLLKGRARELAVKRGAEPVRVLSLPCASGEEPYSIVISLHEGGLLPARLQVEAVDVNSTLIERAREGCFRARSVRELSEFQKERYFSHHDGKWCVESFVREPVNFRIANLYEYHALYPGSRFDIVFCRNLFIYLSAAKQREALDVLSQLLTQDGLLVVGHAETSNAVLERFEPLDRRSGSVLRRRGIAAKDAEHSVGEQVPAHVAHKAPLRRGRAPDFGSVLKLAAGDSRQDAVADLVENIESLANAGELEHAWSRCQLLLEGGSETAEALVLCGVVQEARGRGQDAEELYRRAMAMNPGEKIAVVHLAALLESQGDPEQAQELRSLLVETTKPSSSGENES